MRLMRLCAAAVLAVGTTAAVAQPPGGGRGGFGMMGGGGGMALVGSKTVQEALKLTDEQKSKLKTFNDKQSEKRMSMFRDKVDREEMMEKMRAMQDEAKKELAVVLKDDQAKRLKEIEVQVAGPMAFVMSDVQTALKLSDEQKDKMKDAGEAFQKEDRELRDEMGMGFRPGQPPSRPDPAKQAEYQKKRGGMVKEFMSKVDGILSADQKAEWKKLNGEAIDTAKVQQELQAAMGQFRKKKDD